LAPWRSISSCRSRIAVETRNVLASIFRAMKAMTATATEARITAAPTTISHRPPGVE
jgi:hypothetical protein